MFSTCVPFFGIVLLAKIQFITKGGNEFMKNRKEILLTATGILLGTLLGGPTVHATVEQLNVYPSTQKFYLDGQAIQLEAYGINGYNYVKLGDLCPALGVDLAYDGATNSVYIGKTPEIQEGGVINVPQSDERFLLKEGDQIRCDDGTLYEIKDMSRYDSNVFASGPVGKLPEATCDWSRFPEAGLPKMEARHFTTSTGDTLFIRNLYETRRMQYTIYNTLGGEPSAWKSNVPLASLELSIPEELELYTHSFWPWRASELTDLVHSRPNSKFYVEAWDYYLNGVFQYTRYCVVSM